LRVSLYKRFKSGTISLNEAAQREPWEAAQLVGGDSDSSEGFDDEPLSGHRR
jgi:hypothetical protein